MKEFEPRPKAAAAPELPLFDFFCCLLSLSTVVLQSSFAVVLVWTAFQFSVFRTRSLCAFYYVFRFSLVVSL